jgi:hypothetical protein
MIKRMVAALGAGLVLLGSARAQAPTAPPNGPPSPAAEGPAVPAAACLPSGPATDGAAAGCFWVRGDYVAAWFTGANLPPLVTTSPAGTARTAAGVLGSPSTAVLFGGQSVNDDARSGVRLSGGGWVDGERVWGLEVGFTLLESQASLFAAASDGTTILARPYIDATTGLPQGSLIAFPGSSSGSVFVRDLSGNFYEGHVDLIRNLSNDGALRIDGLVGYRIYRYDEGLSIHQNVASTNPNFVAGTQIVSEDDFNTHNTFQGGELGVRAQYDSGAFSLGVLAKLALGSLYQVETIAGSQVASVPGTTPVSQPGGLLALPSNIGKPTHSQFTVLPEFGVDAAWRFSDHLKAHFGYTGLLLSQVARAADQVDLVLNPTLFPGAGSTAAGPNRPAFTENKTDVWVHTLNFGLEVEY